jgi:transcriptional activator SPT7
MHQFIFKHTDLHTFRDLRKFLQEAKPSKSKWVSCLTKASDERIGQEQLYESLEKVLNALRNHTEHSIPFLKPVQKREAPNYYDIIKRPMDLGTMSKKLKNYQYTSKAEFEVDLNLIWNNCLMYNQMPVY